MKKLLVLLSALLLVLLPAMASAIPMQIGGDSPFPKDAELMEIRFLDMFTAGDAFLLRCGGESMLIDSGHEPFFKHLVMHVENLGVTHINFFLNTHVHADHISGFPHLILRGLGPDIMYLPSKLDARYKYQQKLLDKITKYGIFCQVVGDGDVLRVGGAEVLVMRAKTDLGCNGNSICNVISYGDARVLLMAEATGQAQVELMESYGETLRADILKLAHHGYNRAEKGFFELVKPQIAIMTNVPQGESQESLKQTKAHHVPVFFTPKGNIIAQTDGKIWYVYQEKRVLPN